MKKILLALAVLCFFSGSAQVTQIWSDYNTFWTSSSTSINPVRPNTAHNLLAFRWNGTNYSTAVNNQRLTNNGVSFTSIKFRALPINSVPLTGGIAYFIGLGALADGNGTTTFPNAALPVANLPFAPLTNGQQKAAFLTRGIQGLDLGSCLTNIPTGTPVRFNLSSSGITLSNINDGIPDILVSQVAQPTGVFDTFRFVNAANATVGNIVTVQFNNALYPIVANWNMDFFNNNGTGNITNTQREMRFFAVDFTSFGITTANYTQAVALIYSPSGDSDPAFLAFNEPSLGVSTQLAVTAQPTTSACDGTMPSNFTVRLQDRLGLPVSQAGITITASMETGPGILLGTLTATTNTSGVATFSNLSFEIGGDHTIRFSNSSLDAAITSNIVGDTGCGDNIWTGNGANNNWNNTSNWQTADIPNANNNVEIPTGRPRYPVLQNNAGARNLTLGVNATMDLNGRTFAISGGIFKDVTAKISGIIDNSVLYMSGSSTQIIPSGLILDGNLANLTIENTGGVTNADDLKITQVLLVRNGTFETGNAVEMVCRFIPTRRTGQIGAIGVSGFITGDVTVQQCFPARRAFRFITSSVTTATSIRANWQEGATAWNTDPRPGYGTHITGLGASGSSTNDGTNGFDWQPSGASSLFSFNNSAQVWSAVGSTTGTLTAGEPYRILIRGSRSTDIQLNASVPSNTILRSTGSVVKGPVSVSGLSSTNNAYNLVGNPFQSAVDMSIVINSSANLKPIFYIYDPTLGGNPVVGVLGGRGAYVAVNSLTGVKSNTLSGVTNYLQPYQTFFVQTNNLGTAPELIFNENAKTTSIAQTAVFKAINDDDTIDDQFINLTLFNQVSFDNNDSSSDGLRIDFSSNFNNAIDEYDAIKFTNSDENISRKIGEALISMETRGNAQNGDLLPLHITQYRSSAYTMQIHISDFTNSSVYLKDFYTNQSTLLDNDATSTYNFTVSNANPTSKNADRFAIEILQTPLGIATSKFASAFTLYPNPASGASLFLNSKTAFENAKIEVYNVLGQKISQLTANFASNNQISIPITELNVGVYLITVTTNTGEKFSSKFIKK